MNCKPGDLAVIVHPRHYGKLVTVLYAAPHGRFTMPDGWTHADVSDRGPSWVIESNGSPFEARLRDGTERMTVYAVVGDRWLRPIRPEEGEDESLTWAGKPEQVSA